MARPGFINIIGLVFFLCVLNFANSLTKSCGDSYTFCDEVTEVCWYGTCHSAVDCGYYKCISSKGVCCDEVVSHGCCPSGTTCCGSKCCKKYYCKCCRGQSINYWATCDTDTSRPTTTTPRVTHWWDRTPSPDPIPTRTWAPSTRRPPSYSSSKFTHYESIYIPAIVVIAMVIICIWICVCIRRRQKLNRPVVRGAQAGVIFMVATNRQNGRQTAAVNGSNLAGQSYNNDAYTAELYAAYGADDYKYMPPPPYPGPPLASDPPPAYTTLAYRGASARPYQTLAQQNADVTSSDDVNGAAPTIASNVTSNQTDGHQADSSEQENIYHEIR